MYKELFYLIVKFVKRFKSVRDPEFGSYLFISILISFNILTILMFLGYFVDVNLYRDYNIDYRCIMLPLTVFVMIVNYVLIYLKREEIFEKYDSQNGINKYKALAYKFYILVSYILLFVSFALNQTLFDNKDNVKEQERIQMTIPKLDSIPDLSKSY